MVELNETERKILKFTQEGKTEKEIAKNLNVSTHTVRSFKKALEQKQKV